MERNKVGRDTLYRRIYYKEIICRPNIARVIKYRRLRWADHVARKEEGRIAFKILTGKTTGMKPLGRRRRRRR